MGNLMFKISSLFCLNMGVPERSPFWGGIGAWFVNLGSWIWELLSRFIYTLIRFVLNIVDFLQFFVQSLVGVNDWRNGEVNIDNIGESDLIFKFIFHGTVQKVFKYMMGIFFVLLIVFTIIAIVKNEYAFAVADDVTKASNSKAKVFKSSLKAIFLVFIIPLFIVLGILSSNAILASILNAINGGNNVTFGGQIFSASAYEANKYRAYANAGVRIPVTNNVKVGDTLVSSSLPTVVPCDFKKNNKFTGYMFSLDFNGEKKDYLYYVEADADGTEYTSIYNYITSTLGGTIKYPDDAKYDQWGYGDKGIKINLHEYEKESSVNQAAYNTWFYNEILTRNYTFEETVEKKTVSNPKSYIEYFDTTKTMYQYTNTGDWAKLHDGGKEGLVALPQEYSVNADVLDFMIRENIELSVVSFYNNKIKWSTASLIKESKSSSSWSITQSIGALNIDSKLVDTTNKNFVVGYSDCGYVLYQPEKKNTEEEGAIFIYAYKNPTAVNHDTGVVEDYEYLPLLNNKDKIPINKICSGKNDAGKWEYWLEPTEAKEFQSDSLASDYDGLIVARGVLDSTYAEISGRPTQIVEDWDYDNTATQNEESGNCHDLTFERDVVDGGKWHFDICLNVLNLFDSDGATWRCRISIGTSYGESEREKSDFSANKGIMRVDYNFVSSENPGIKFSTFFIAGKMNVVILVFSAILVMVVLGQAVWGLIARIYDIALYFLVMPAVVASTPLEYSKNIYSNWQSNLIKKVFGAYGVLIGLNLYFVLLGPIKDASKIFSAGDIQHAISEGNVFASMSAGALNNIVFLLFSLVAITLIKTLPKTISEMFAFEDSYSKGADVKSAVETNVKEVTNHVSGKSLMTAADTWLGEKGKDGKRHDGYLRGFIPGSAVYKSVKAKLNEKNGKKAEEKAEEEAYSKMADAERAYKDAESGYTLGSDETTRDAGISTDLVTSETEGTSEYHSYDMESEGTPEISDAGLSALKTDILNQLQAMLDSALIDQQQKSNQLAYNPTSLSAQAEYKNAQDRVNAIQTSISQVKSDSFDASGLDNMSVTQYGKTAKLRSELLSGKSNYSVEAGAYGQALSFETRRGLESLSKDRVDLDQKRTGTQELVEKLKKGTALENKKNLTSTEIESLITSNGLSYDKNLKVAYYTGSTKSKRFEEFDIASSKDVTRYNNMKVAERMTAGQAELQQRDIAGGLAEKLVRKAEGKPLGASVVASQTRETVNRTTAERREVDRASDVNAAKRYADAAKAYAEAAKKYSDVSTGKVQAETSRDKNMTERKLDKLIRMQEKRDEKQEKGKAKTFMFSSKNKQEAYENYNNNKSLNESIINKSSSAVQQAAVDKYNEEQQKKFKRLGDKYKEDLIYDKEKDRKVYLSKAEEYYRANFMDKEFNLHEAERAFDKHQAELRETAVETHFDDVLTDAKIKVWNQTHSEKDQIKDAKDMEARKLTKKVENVFAQDQENKKVRARNDYLNDRLDNKIAKQRQRVEDRGDAGFVGYALKSTVGKALKLISRKTTAKDVEKLQERLKFHNNAAEVKRGNIEYINEKIKEQDKIIKESRKAYNELEEKKKTEKLTQAEEKEQKKLAAEMAVARDNKKEFERARQTEEVSLETTNKLSDKINRDLLSGRQGLLYNVRSHAKTLADGKRAKKADKVIKKLQGKEDELDKGIRGVERARDRVGIVKERSFDLGKDVNGNSITREGYYTDNQQRTLEAYAKNIGNKQNRLNRALEDAKNAKPEERKAKDKIVKQAMKDLEYYQTRFDKAEKQFKKDNGESYLNRREDKLIRVKSERLKKEKQQLFREMEKALSRGDDTTGYIEAIESKDKAIKNVGEIPPRFKAFRNFGNSTIVTAKKIGEYGNMALQGAGNVASKAAYVVTIPLYPIKLVGKASANIAGKVASKVGLQKLSKVKKAKKLLAQEKQIEQTQARHQKVQTDAQDKRSIAEEVLSEIPKEQFIQKVRSALIKSGRGDLAESISDEATARAILNRELDKVKQEHKRVRDIVKAAETGSERTSAVAKQKEIEKTLRMLQRVSKQQVVSTSAQPKSVDTTYSDALRQKVEGDRQRSASSVAESRKSSRRSATTPVKEKYPAGQHASTEKAGKPDGLTGEELKRAIKKEFNELMSARADFTRQRSDAVRSNDQEKVKKLDKELKKLEKQMKKNKYKNFIPKIIPEDPIGPEGK